MLYRQARSLTLSASVCFWLAGACATAQTLTVTYPSASSLTPPLSQLPDGPKPNGNSEHAHRPVPSHAGSGGGPDTAVQTSAGPLISATGGANFDGPGANGYAPSDNNIAVGPNHIFAAVNSVYQIFTKTGASVLGPKTLSSLWTGVGGGCATANAGDVVVQYDKLADRWILTQLSSLSSPYGECIAVSTSGDPTGTYKAYYYSFSTNLPDYPKFGVWPTTSNGAYLASYNQFANGASFAGAALCAYDRTAMLAGAASPGQICFTINDASYLPADLDGSTPPANGSPGYFVTSETLSSLRIWKLAPNFATPAASTLTQATPDLAVTAFTELCSGGVCVPQTGTNTQLDSLADRPMYRLAYRNFGDHEAMVFNHSATSGPRWYELRATGGAFSVYQQGTYAPDATFRWMGSAAMDQAGDLAIGYSASSSSIHPAVRYSGRVPGDPLGTLETEGSIIEGAGSQTNNLHRWGDYSSLRIDPSNDCTFWYINEYLKADGAYNWSTRIGSFTFSSCGVSDLTIAKTHSGNFTQGDTGKTYSLTVTNSGGAATSGTVTVSDTIPAGLTATAISGTGWSCTQPAGPCTRSDALNAGASYPAITLTVNVAGNAPASVTNTATVSGGGEVNTGNDTGSDPTIVNSLNPDLTIAKTHSGNFTQGDTGKTYSLTVTNSGGAATSGTVTVSDTIPAGLTATAISGTGWSCTLPAGPCTRSDALNAGASYPAITLTVNVAGNAPASVTNTATVSGGGEVNTGNDTASDPTIVNPTGGAPLAFLTGFSGTGGLSNNFTGFAGMKFTVGANALSVSALGRIFITGNSGNHTVKLVQAATGTDVPGGSVSVSMAGGVAGQFKYIALGSPVTLQANTAYYLVSQEASGADQWYDTGGVSSTAAAAVNSSIYSYDSVTWNAYNAANTSYVPANFQYTLASLNPDLTIAKTHSGNFTQGDTGKTYSLTVTNSGGAATSGTVTVSDTIPAGLTATAISGTGWSCTQPAGPCTRSDALNAGASYPAITLTVNVAANAPASVTNTATVSGGGEVNTGNDTASDPTIVNSLNPDLTIVKTHSGNFTQGDTGKTYSLTVTNSGGAATSGTVTVSDTIPAGLTATAISGTGWSCTQPAGPCTRSDALNAGASYPAITLTVNVASNAPASVTNTATVSGGGEVNTGNDTASDPTIVNPTGGAPLAFLTGFSGTGGLSNNFTGFAGMKFTVGANALSVSALGRIFITGNSGNHTVKLVQAATGTDVPGGSVSVSMAGGVAGQFKYVALGSPVTLQANTAYYLVSQEVSGADQWYDTGGVSSTAAAAVNSSIYSANSVNWNAYNAANTSYVPANFQYTLGSLNPDLTIAKTHAGNFTQGDTGKAYSLTVTNSGGAATSGTVTVSDTIPAGLTATAISGTGWSCTQPAGPCTRSDALNAGASYPAITLTVNVAGNAPASVTNTATVSGGGEVNTGNDTASDPTIVNSLNPDLTIVKTHSGNFTQGDTGKAYSLTVTNSGGAATSGTVTVSDTIPAGLTATAISGTGWSCTQPAGPCTRSDALNAGASYPAITLTVNVASNAPASVTNTATVSGGGEVNTGNDTASDPTIVNPTGGAPLAFLTGFSGTGGLSNNFTGFAGMKFTVGANALSVSALGRIFITGNSGNHTVKLVQAATGTDVPGGSVSVSMAGGVAGQFKYVALGSPVTLQANTAYYLVSQEVSGADQWYDTGGVSSTTAAAVNSSIYSANSVNWNAYNAANTSYVPANFQYH